MKLDNEWVELIIEAKCFGITINEIKLFFKMNSQNKHR
ncbi:DNA-binding anti-repressor SinI [Cytobacillus purgationiresistens]|nr:DNA-binding anti-repressor SinI [Cytobacillus purgationiresistens]